MKRSKSTLQRNMRILALAGIISVSLIGCAHEINSTKSAPSVTPIAISPYARPADEITNMEKMIVQANEKHVDVLAPIHFDETKNYLAKAIKQNQEGASAEAVLKSVGYAKAYLIEANQKALLTHGNVTEVTIARQQALNAGARNAPKKLVPLDNELKKYSQSFSENKNSDKKAVLVNQYLALELFCIKEAKLTNVQTILHQAKMKGAEKITPEAYAQAVQKYNISEKLIEIDRHSNEKIKESVATATVAANRVLTLLVSEQSSRTQTPEQRAVNLESRDIALKQASMVISDVAADNIKKDIELEEQNANLAMSKDENEEHLKKAHEDKVIADAVAQFDKSEADVYRQDGSVIIRLKSMNFASGRSDLPADSIAVLNKVKEIIKDIGPGQVTVEGHTDGVGNASINQRLSKDRAQSVMKFFSTDKILENNEMNFTGYGYTKPLATNKTKEGRAQNRRVDIVIKPSQLI